MARLRISCAAVAVLGCTLTTPVALAEGTANLALTSNYVWRGVSQTNDGAALQGGLEYSHGSGLYAGAWASNVEGGNEYDLYGGLSNKLDELTYDIGYFTYNYTDRDLNQRKEVKLGVGYGGLTFDYYMGDNGADTGNEYTYYDFAIEKKLADDVVLRLHYGLLDSDVAGVKAMDDYGATLTRDLNGLKVSASYTTHEEGEELFFITLSRELKL